jgi:hypothetical protein
VVFDGLDLDGSFVQMVDSSGNVFYAAGLSPRALEGEGWVKPGLKLPRLPGPFPSPKP